MDKLTAIIVDDELHCQVTLTKQIEWTELPVEILACCSSVEEAKIAIAKCQPHVVFLDIEMPEKNGFDLLYELPEINFDVVFTTAYDEFAVEAFNTNAVAYLLKPILLDELKATLEKIKVQQESRFTQEKLVELYETMTRNSGMKKVPIPTSDGIEFVKAENIIRCQADGNYTYIYRVNDDPIFISKTLKQLEELLKEYQFIRPHNSHLINLQYIKSYQKGSGGSITMEDGTIVPVSRYRKDEIQSLL